MDASIVERAALLAFRGCLRSVEFMLQLVADAFDRPAQNETGESTMRSQLRGQARTAAGTLETVDFDEDGHRVGVGTRAPVVRDE